MVIQTEARSSSASRISSASSPGGLRPRSLNPTVVDNGGTAFTCRDMVASHAGLGIYAQRFRQVRERVRGRAPSQWCFCERHHDGPPQRSMARSPIPCSPTERITTATEATRSEPPGPGRARQRRFTRARSAAYAAWPTLARAPRWLPRSASPTRPRFSALRSSRSRSTGERLAQRPGRRSALRSSARAGRISKAGLEHAASVATRATVAHCFSASACQRSLCPTPTASSERIDDLTFAFGDDGALWAVSAWSFGLSGAAAAERARGGDDGRARRSVE